MNLGKFSLTLWCLWRYRNHKVLNNHAQPARIVMVEALYYLCRWIVVRNKREFYMNQAYKSSSWNTLSPSFMKWNTDATLLANDMRIGLGMVLCDFRILLQVNLLLLLSYLQIKKLKLSAYMKLLTGYIHWVHCKKKTVRLPMKRYSSVITDKNPY